MSTWVAGSGFLLAACDSRKSRCDRDGTLPTGNWDWSSGTRRLMLDNPNPETFCGCHAFVHSYLRVFVSVSHSIVLPGHWLVAGDLRLAGRFLLPTDWKLPTVSLSFSDWFQLEPNFLHGSIVQNISSVEYKRGFQHGIINFLPVVSFKFIPLG